MAPLYASVSDFEVHCPGFNIEWDSRSLADFGDGNLETLVDKYDLLVFDHPFVGQAESEGLLVNLSELLPPDDLRPFRKDALGPCWKSYWTDGGLWALPIDAAAQVASYIPGILSRYRDGPPETLNEVFDLARELRGDGLYIALPCVPIDAICLFFTLTAGLGEPIPDRPIGFPSQAIVEETLETMRRLIAVAHPQSLRWNPILCFDHMASHDDVAYQPYAFGYSNYARPGSAKHVLKFANIPAVGELGSTGSILGGAGIGITRRCGNVGTALEYIKFVCSPEYQSRAYFNAGGQPASRAAWQSGEVDKASNGFFSGTFQTLEKSYLRPTFNGIIPWFKKAGDMLHDYLSNELPQAECARKLRDEFLGAGKAT
jgi:multiple sugar transport system substrate-binding protein